MRVAEKLDWKGLKQILCGFKARIKQLDFLKLRQTIICPSSVFQHSSVRLSSSTLIADPNSSHAHPSHSASTKGLNYGAEYPRRGANFICDTYVAASILEF
jgi:hypothetical protein